MIDASGIPSCVCLNCGSNLFNIVASFDPETYEIEMWGLEATCNKCNTKVTAPCPIDHPSNIL